MMSAPEDADLLKAASWTSSNRLDHNAAWLGGKFGGWLFTVARNKAFSERRRDQLRAGAPRPDPPEAAATPEAEVEKKQTLALLAEAIRALSDPHRDVLMLKEVAGLTYSQIAAVQNVPEGTAKSRLHHAIRSVRRFFAERTGGLNHDEDV